MCQTNLHLIRAFFDEPTNTVSYLVSDPMTKCAVVIDPVLDYDHRAGMVDVRSVEAILQAAEQGGLTIDWVLETHAHADHLSGAPWIKRKTGASVGIGEHITDVQRIFRPLFSAEDVTPDGSAFDSLFADGDRLDVGQLTVEVLYTPGHTPADVSYRIGDAVFVGDTLFMPDYGRRARTSPAAMPTSSIARSSDCWRCRQRRGSSSVTTTRRRGATTTLGRPPSARSRPAMCISATACRNSNSSRCGLREMPRWRRRRRCCHRSKSNIRAGNFPAAQSNGIHYLMVPVRPRPGAEAALA